MSFERDIARFTRQVNNRLEKIVKDSLNEVVKRLVFRSPVDTSRFSANWYSSNKKLLTDFNYNIYDQTRNISIRRGQDAVNKYKLGDSFWISNHTPYGERLEYGYSQQAPMGILRITANEWSNIVRSKAK